MSVSVVVPNYNHARYLPFSLTSILAQELRPEQIVVVDDKSTDDSIAVVERFAGRHQEIELIRHEENRGPPAVLNTGLRHAKGKFVAFIGADDLVLPGLFARTVGALECYPSAALACGEVALLGPDERILGFRPFALPAWRDRFITPEAVVRLSDRSDNWIVGTATVYRRGALEAIAGFDEALGSFCDGLAVRQLAFTRGFCFVPEVLGVWRRSQSTYSTSTAFSQEVNNRILNGTLERFAKAFGPQLAATYCTPFSRRWRFGAAQSVLRWETDAVDPDRLVAAMAGSERDRKILKSIRTLVGHGRLGRILALAWITVRTRPMRKRTMVANALRTLVLGPLRRRQVRRHLRGLCLAATALMGEPPPDQNQLLSLQSEA